MIQLLHFDDYLNSASLKRNLIQRIFFGSVLLILLLNFRSHILLHQIGRNPILYQEIDPVYWLFMILKLPDLIGLKMPFLFDAVLVGSATCSFIWPWQNKSTIVFFISYFIYFVLYNMMAGHHYAILGILFMSFPFTFRFKENFAYALLFCRFIFCFIMFSAGMWKVTRGNLFFPDQIQVTLISENLVDLLANKSNMQMFIIKWLIQHPPIAHIFWVIMIILELFFFIGFLTLSFDFFLLACYLLFALGGWFLFNIFIYENLLFLFSLAPFINLIRPLREK